MSDPDILDVWYEQRLVGQLWRNTTGAVGFRYYPEWITGGGFAVSRSLAARQGERKRGRVVRGRRRVRAGGRRPPARTSTRRPVIVGEPVVRQKSARLARRTAAASRSGAERS
ncbi:hypothetical protein C4901_06585 [Acidiferrobacter sp. SPIII_3]|uniref:HipA N-terminal domain-containing protein n=1 Tax=Acidiferrobacter sp. SPIII_3 TaxID=1281578 RepID=UPI000D72E3C4|nr:hypothetical protein C4901_06585 [Acidiferrobacter sp. SPIII_3]